MNKIKFISLLTALSLLTLPTTVFAQTRTNSSLESKTSVSYQTINPMSAGDVYVASPIDASGNATVTRYLVNGDISKYIESYHINIYRDIVGSVVTSGDAVKAVQVLLNMKENAGLFVDGQYGPNTRNAIVRFQQYNSIGVDGLVGPSTWTQLLQ